MSAPLPAKLKGELQRFATRAAQLQQYRPIVAYWCEYYILQQILAKSYHANDKECETYAVQLMDKLEQRKAENPSNDAIVDDVAAKAYMENFALDTFNRGDDAQRINNVTKQTADTFMAAATFLDLLSIWGEVDKEIAAKSKFAKFHAARILRAFKAGEDPNATNPVVEEPAAPAEDGMDDELKAMERQQEGADDGGVYKPPTVESAPDSGMPSRPQSTQPSQPMAPPPLASGSPNGPAPPAPNEHDVSPIEPADNSNPRQASIGGGYFPEVPSAPEAPAEPNADVDMTAAPPQEPSNPQDFYNEHSSPLVDPTAPSPASLGIGSPNRPHKPPPDEMAPSPSAAPWLQPPPPHIQAQQRQQRQQSPQVPQAPAPPPAPAPAHAQPSIPQATTRTSHGPPPGGYNTDDESSMAAQKHARWAISALNFEDVNTAVKELRLALESLGAT